MNVDNQALSSLNQVFVNLLSPDNATRRAGEEYLKNFEKTPGFAVIILTLINKLSQSTSPHDVANRQSAAVYVKNMVKRRWDPKNEEVCFSCQWN